jgi:SAM-dependent methyltransferase
MTSEDSSSPSTDSEWEEWGRRDPYFGVITQPRFRRGAMTEEAKKDFFESGRLHVDYVLQAIRRNINPTFVPKSVLDFGCGVGRTLVAFARAAEHAVGLDISPSMLEEAKRNCDEQRLTNVTLLLSDDSVASISTEKFDLIHSFIVFQHIPPERGRHIFRDLLGCIAPGGVGAIHVLYSKTRYASTYGVAPVPAPWAGLLPLLRRQSDEPEMQMNPYLMNELLFFMQSRSVQRFYADFTDHGGELGLFLFFQVP